MFLKILLTLPVICLARTDGDYYPKRGQGKFDVNPGGEPIEVFPELHLKDYEKDSLNKHFYDKSCACGKSNPAKHFKKTEPHEVHPPNKYPWMVAIKYSTNNTKFCGGSLITDQFILTAAHCFDRNSEHAFINKAKHNDLRNPSEISVLFVTETEQLQPGPPIEKLIPYPNFNFYDVNHDIGLIKLTRPVPCGKFTRPICLSPVGVPVTVGKVFTITGWGIEEIGDEEGSKTLLQAKIKHVPFSKCEEKFPKKMQHNYYCLKGLNDNSPCHGDSGGPMFKEDRGTYYILGVASMHSSDLCHPEDVFIYTAVSPHIPWIHSVLKSSTTHRQFPHPVDKKVSKPVDKKVSHPVDKKVSHKVDKEVSHPVDKKVSHKVDKEVSHPVDKEVSHPVDKKVSHQVDKKVSHLVDKVSHQVDKKVSHPVGKHVSHPVDKKVSHPVGRLVSYPVSHRIPSANFMNKRVIIELPRRRCLKN